MLMGMLCIAWIPLYFRHCKANAKLLAYWYFCTITFDILTILGSRRISMILQDALINLNEYYEPSTISNDC